MPENDPQKKRPYEAEADNEEESRRSYYYDDSHGYEDFDPDSDELEDEE